MYIKYDPPPPRPQRHSLVERGVLVAFVGITLGVGVVGGLATAAGRDGWYQALAKPPLTPPDWVFAPVWTTLYVLMGIAVWRIWRQGDGFASRRDIGRTRPGRTLALGLWGMQLALNLLWSVLFFALKTPLAALGDLVAMLAVLAATVWTFHARDDWAGALMLPTLVWVMFAGYLNAGIVALN